MQQKHINYHDGDTELEAYCAYIESDKKKPVILIAHDWSGKNDFAKRKADKLAELGYIGFAIDMFGKGKIGKTKEEKSALIQPFIQDRNKLQQRILAAYEAAKKFDAADTSRIGAIGFCFGGMCVLDLARSGADMKGIVSFHGLLQAPEGTATHLIKAKVLALHGYDDPMVTPDIVMHFGNEMTAAKVDWQLHMYGHAVHAFTNPEANDKSFGTVYNKLADARSWTAMCNFFTEVLS